MKNSKVEFYNITHNDIEILLSQTITISKVLYDKHKMICKPKYVNVVIDALEQGHCISKSYIPHCNNRKISKEIAIGHNYCKILLKETEDFKDKEKRILDELDNVLRSLGLALNLSLFIDKFVECILVLLNKKPKPYNSGEWPELLEINFSGCNKIPSNIAMDLDKNGKEIFYWIGNGINERIPKSVADEFYILI